MGKQASLLHFLDMLHTWIFLIKKIDGIDVCLQNMSGLIESYIFTTVSFYSMLQMILSRYCIWLSGGKHFYFFMCDNISWPENVSLKVRWNSVTCVVSVWAAGKIRCKQIPLVFGKVHILYLNIQNFWNMIWKASKVKSEANNQFQWQSSKILESNQTFLSIILFMCQLEWSDKFQQKKTHML